MDTYIMRDVKAQTERCDVLERISNQVFNHGSLLYIKSGELTYKINMEDHENERSIGANLLHQLFELNNDKLIDMVDNLKKE